VDESEVVHGGPDHAELAAAGLDPAGVIDFSANVNPYGPPPGVTAAVRRAALDRYPDRECLALRRALAARLGVDAGWIVCGNGAAELIHLLARITLRAGDTVVVAGPTFGEYARAARLHGATVVEVDAAYPLGGDLCREPLLAAIAATRPRLVWLCSPNNPTGGAAGAADVAVLLDAVAAGGGLLVADEAYADLQLDGAPADLRPLLAGPAGDSLVLLRSLTKGYALAGLRLGYVVARPLLVAALRRVRPPWNVSAPAQAAGVAALAGDEYLVHSRARLAATKRRLAAALARAGYAATIGRANWLLVEVGDAAAVRRRLLGEALLVRDCASFGLPGHIRVAVRRPAECRRLVAALSALAAEDRR
jgi:L-threonine-O-3-phosphate decarboxylase